MPTPRLVAVTLALCCAGLVSVSSATAQDALPVSEQDALKVVERHNAINERNNETLDIEGQGMLEDPPLRTIDDANFREYQARGQTGLGENITIENVQVFVPDQSSYPLTFLAFEEFTGPDLPEPGRQILLFVKQGEAQPWKATMAAQLTEPLPEVTLDNFGLARLVKSKAASKLEVKPSSLSKKLTKLWTRSLDGTVTSVTFEAGLLTTEAPQFFLFGLQQLPIEVETEVDFEFEPSENQPVCLAATGGALCFFVTTIHTTLQPATGSLVQPESREPLTGLVVPGEYGEVRFDNTAIMFGFVPKKSRNERVEVFGVYEGTVRAETSAATEPAV